MLKNERQVYETYWHNNNIIPKTYTLNIFNIKALE